MVTRGRYRLAGDRVRLQNQLEALLEDACITLPSVVGNPLGAICRRILQALAVELDKLATATLRPGTDAVRRLPGSPDSVWTPPNRRWRKRGERQDLPGQR